MTGSSARRAPANRGSRTLRTQPAASLAYRLGHSHVGQMGLGDHKRQDASIFVWARVTQGEHLLAPHP